MAIRVLYVADSLMAGGIEAQLVELLTRLDRARFEPHVLCLYGPRAGREPRFAPPVRAADIPLTLLDIGWGARDKLVAAQRIAATVRRLRPRIVQAEGYHANLLTRAVRPLMPPTQLIGTVRGLETPKQLRYQRLGQRACARIVTSGPQLTEMVVRRAGVPAAKVVTIPNAINVRRFAAAPPSAGELRRELAPEGQRVLLSVGRISAQKRMHLLAEALGLLKAQGRLPANTRVCILGQVEDAAMQAQLQAAITAHGLEAVIVQHAETDAPEAYYHAADATLLYTILEGISIAMLESLAAGRPVIISEEANAAGVIAHGRAGWIVPTHDLTRFAETLAEVLTLPGATLDAMRAACVRRAQDFAIETLVRRYTDLYTSLAD